MALDLETEDIISFREGAKSCPGGSVNISTVHRWRLKGIRGIRLETMLRAGRRVTSRQAMARFFARITAVADGEPVPSQTPKQRERAIKIAERELEESDW